MNIHVKMKLGHRYAGTFLDPRMGKENILLLAAEMQFISDAFRADPLVEEFFSSPTLSRGKKIQVIRAFAEQGGFSRYTRELLEILVRRRRGDIIPFVSRELHITADQILVRKRVRMTTAAEPSVTEIQGLSKRIGAFFKKTVFVERAVDPGIIGGFVLEGDGKLVDLSVKGQIERALLER